MWDGRLARQSWNGKDGRDARPTLTPYRLSRQLY